MLPSSFRLSASRVLPLPGVGELEGAISGLRDTLKASGYANKEYESLAAHLESLLDIVRLAGRSEDFAELSSELTDIRSRLEAEFKRKSRMGVVKSQARFELLCNLDREVARIVTRSQFKLLAQLRVAQQKNSMVENIPTVPSHELELRDELSSISSSLGRLTWGSHYPGGSGSEGVITNRRAGYYGSLPVVYQTYTSKSDNTAAEQAEMDLRLLSKLAHANIPSLIAVTKGCYGINGIVMQIDAKIALPPDEFLSGSMPGVSLVRYIRGVHSLSEFLDIHQKDRTFPMVETITTDSNGHIIVLPFTGRNDGQHCSFDPFDLLGQHQNLDPGLCVILSWQFENSFTYKIGGPRSADAQDFLNGVSALPPSFSELQVLKLAAKFGPFHPIFSQYIKSSTAPNFVMSPGDIGSMVGPQNGSWEGLLLGGKFDVEAIEWYLDAQFSVACSMGCRWKCCPSTSSEYNTWVIHCGHDFTGIGLKMSCSNPGWGHIMQSAKEVSKKHNVNLNTLSYCSIVIIFVQFTGNGMQHQRPIYFHRNQFCRSDPRAFWGFFSLSSDPRSPSTGLEALDDGIVYSLYMDSYNICDDWGIKYEEALEKGLESMPGGYPGARVEEMLDEGAEQVSVRT